MTERERIHNIINDLHLADGRYVLSGSAVMTLHGFDRAPRDIDIFVATATWFSLYHETRSAPLPPDAGDHRVQVWDLFVTDPDDPQTRSDPPYLYRVMHGIEVNIFQSWRRRGVGDIDVAFWLHNATVVDGIRCIPLNFLLDWKEQVGREKDVQDISVLRKHLRRAA